MQALGLKSYRFSISWPRVLPAGRGRVNPKGLDFYDRLVDELLAPGSSPRPACITGTCPRPSRSGGWANRQTAEWFGEYARLVFDRLGDRVDVGDPQRAVGVGFPGLRLRHVCARHGRLPAWLTAVAHNLLLAHARRGAGFPARAGIAARSALCWICEHTCAASDSEIDRAGLRSAIRNTNDDYLFPEPLFKGSYPPSLMDWLGAMAPQVQPGDLELIQPAAGFPGRSTTTARCASAYDPCGGYLKCRASAPHTAHDRAIPRWAGASILPGLTAVLVGSARTNTAT